MKDDDAAQVATPIAALVCISVLLVSLSALAATDLQPHEATGPTSRETNAWTIMIYMAADNDLERYSIPDMNELERLDLPDDVSIVVQYDRIPHDDNSNGNWNNTRRYEIQHGTDDDIIESPLIEDMTEQNMGDPDTLTDFMRWGIENYPSGRYMLLLWDHGDGLFSGARSEPQTRGVCKDNTDGDQLELWEIQESLDIIVNDELQGRPLDILATDVCLFGYLEVVRCLDGLADYYISSTDEVPAFGWDYELALASLETKSYIWPPDLCQDIVNAYDATFKHYPPPNDFYQLFACDVDLFNDQFLPEFEAFTEVLLNYTYDHRAKIKALAETVDGPQYHPEQYFYRDIKQFLMVVSDESTLPMPLRIAADKAIDAFEGVTIEVCCGGAHEISYGPGIYFRLKDNLPNRYKSMDCFNTGLWDEFLYELLEPTGLYHEPVKNVESTSTMEFTVLDRKGLDIQWVKLVYSEDPTFNTSNSEVLAKITTKIYTTNVEMSKSQHYYFQVRLNDGKDHYLPSSTIYNPEGRHYSFTVGPDTTPPVVTHYPLGEMKMGNNDIEVICQVTDDLGVDPASVQIGYKRVDLMGDEVLVDMSPIAAEGNEEIMLTFGTGNSPNTLYKGTIPSMPLGAIVDYRIKAKDTAATPNTGQSPKVGWHRFYVNGTNGPVYVDRYHSDLTDHTNLLQFIEDMGFITGNVTEKYSMSVLEDCKILLVIEPKSALATDERQVLDSMMSNGMELMIIGTGETQQDLTNTNTFVPDFSGLSFGIDAVTNGENYTLEIMEEDILPNTNKIAYGDYTCIQQLSTGVSKSLVLNNELNPIVSWGMNGDGRMIAISDEVLDNTHFSMHDNQDFALDILDHLARNIAPIPVIEVPARVDTGTIFTIDARDSYDTDGEVVSYSWTYDRKVLSSSSELTHSFSEAGYYTISLKISDSEGSSAMTHFDLFVNKLPIPTISEYSRDSISWESIDFGSSAQDTDGTIVSYDWSFGDGIMQSGREVSHFYSYPGTFVVTLNVTDDLGSSAQSSITITIFNRDPTADFLSSDIVVRNPEVGPNSTQKVPSTPIVINEDDTLFLDGYNSTDLDSDPATMLFIWDFGDEHQAQGIAQTQTFHTYRSEGVYNLSLTVRDTYGGEGSQNITVGVKNIAPKAYMDLIASETEVSLNASASWDTPSDRTNLSYIWKFSDTENTYITTRPEITHDFRYGGEYEVTLTVRDDNGAEDSTTTSVVVAGPPKPEENAPVGTIVAVVIIVLLIIIIVLVVGFLYYRHRCRMAQDRVIFERVEDELPPSKRRRGFKKKGGSKSFSSKRRGKKEPEPEPEPEPKRFSWPFGKKEEPEPEPEPKRGRRGSSRPERKTSGERKTYGRKGSESSSRGSSRAKSNPFK